jgi:hypothetical protein
MEEGRQTWMNRIDRMGTILVFVKNLSLSRRVAQNSQTIVDWKET